jgi:hypothetical protein
MPASENLHMNGSVEQAQDSSGVLSEGTLASCDFAQNTSPPAATVTITRSRSNTEDPGENNTDQHAGFGASAGFCGGAWTGFDASTGFCGGASTGCLAAPAMKVASRIAASAASAAVTTPTGSPSSPMRAVPSCFWRR